MSADVYATPMEAEAAFYDAFQRADLDAMMRVWADDDTIVCVHPVGPRLQGRSAVMASWRQIFGGGTPMRFELTDTRWVRENELSFHCVHERIDFGEGLRQHSVVIATNAYRRVTRGWRMILHHASPGTLTESPAPGRQHAVH